MLGKLGGKPAALVLGPVQWPLTLEERRLDYGQHGGLYSLGAHLNRVAMSRPMPERVVHEARSWSES